LRIAGAAPHEVGEIRFPLAEAAAAQRYLIEDRPYGRVLLRA
jgi:hypothetical protein